MYSLFVVLNVQLPFHFPPIRLVAKVEQPFMDDASDRSPSPVLGEFHKLMQEFVSCINSLNQENNTSSNLYLCKQSSLSMFPQTLQLVSYIQAHSAALSEADPHWFAPLYECGAFGIEFLSKFLPPSTVSAIVTPDYRFKFLALLRDALLDPSIDAETMRCYVDHLEQFGRNPYLPSLPAIISTFINPTPTLIPQKLGIALDFHTDFATEYHWFRDLLATHPNIDSQRSEVYLRESMVQHYCPKLGSTIAKFEISSLFDDNNAPLTNFSVFSSNAKYLQSTVNLLTAPLPCFPRHPPNTCVSSETLLQSSCYLLCVSMLFIIGHPLVLNTIYTTITASYQPPQCNSHNLCDENIIETAKPHNSPPSIPATQYSAYGTSFIDKLTILTRNAVKKSFFLHHVVSMMQYRVFQVEKHCNFATLPYLPNPATLSDLINPLFYLQFQANPNAYFTSDLLRSTQSLISQQVLFYYLLSISSFSTILPKSITSGGNDGGGFFDFPTDHKTITNASSIHTSLLNHTSKPDDVYLNAFFLGIIINAFQESNIHSYHSIFSQFCIEKCCQYEFPPPSVPLIFHTTFLHSFIAFSHHQYQTGQPTLYQYLLLHAVRKQIDRLESVAVIHTTCDCFLFFFLLSPFQLLISDQRLLQQHILLTAHAGFTNSLLIPHPDHPDESSPSSINKAISHLNRMLIPFRSIIYVYLLSKTGLSTLFQLPSQNALQALFRYVISSTKYRCDVGFGSPIGFAWGSEINQTARSQAVAFASACCRSMPECTSPELMSQDISSIKSNKTPPLDTTLGSLLADIENILVDTDGNVLYAQSRKVHDNNKTPMESLQKSPFSDQNYNDRHPTPEWARDAPKHYDFVIPNSPPSPNPRPSLTPPQASKVTHIFVYNHHDPFDQPTTFELFNLKADHALETPKTYSPTDFDLDTFREIIFRTWETKGEELFDFAADPVQIRQTINTMFTDEFLFERAVKGTAFSVHLDPEQGWNETSLRYICNKTPHPRIKYDLSYSPRFANQHSNDTEIQLLNSQENASLLQTSQIRTFQKWYKQLIQTSIHAETTAALTTLKSVISHATDVGLFERQVADGTESLHSAPPSYPFPAIPLLSSESPKDDTNAREWFLEIFLVSMLNLQPVSYVATPGQNSSPKAMPSINPPRSSEWLPLFCQMEPFCIYWANMSCLSHRSPQAISANFEYMFDSLFHYQLSFVLQTQNLLSTLGNE